MEASVSPAVRITPPIEGPHFRVLRFDHVEPDCEDVYRLVGLRRDRGNHARWFDQVARMLDELRRVMRPRGIYRIDDVAALEPTRVRLASGAEYQGTVGRFLEHTTQIATYVVTIGSGVERLSRGWLRQGKVMQGTIADAIASTVAEATAERLRGEVRAWARGQGLDATPGYSPGYCGLHVRQQQTLFASLPTQRINVHLTPSCLMLPVKSVSGLIGIGPAGKVSGDSYPCQHCDHPHCTQRRAPYDGSGATGD